MNISDTNFVIHSINGVVEILVALNQDIEQKAWDSFEDHAGMSGERPATAHSLAEPSPTQHASSQPQLSAPAPEPTEPTCVIGGCAWCSRRAFSSGSYGEGAELIVAAGADKHSAVDPAKFGWLLERATEIADGTV